jgi:hypothetical protein
LDSAATGDSGETAASVGIEVLVCIGDGVRVWVSAAADVPADVVPPAQPVSIVAATDPITAAVANLRIVGLLLFLVVHRCTPLTMRGR